MQIKNHYLESQDVSITRRPSDNHGGKYAAGKADTIVLHYTAGRSAESAVKTLTGDGTGVSAHLVVGRDGKVFQLVPFDTVAWHAGTSEYRGRVGLNRYSIGIEMDNAGILKRTADNQFEAWFGGTYPASDAIEGIHRNEQVTRFWHRYSEAQIEVVERICATLIATYGINTIVGHEEIAPHRKSDPGPAFPLDKLRTRLLLEKRSADDGPSEPAPAVLTAAPSLRRGFVTVQKLNVRRAGSVTAPTVSTPLARDTMVTIEEDADGWHRIRRPVAGWVKSDYVRVVT